MSKDANLPAQEPIEWPSSTETREFLRRYVDWLRSGGFEGSELDGPFDFRGADLTGFELRWQILWGANFSGVNLDHADLYKAELVDAVLDSASLRFAQLHKTDMSGCTARHASFMEANLLNAKFSDAILTGANFQKSWLGGTRFFDSDLRDADFRGAKFGTKNSGEWTDFSDSRMHGCQVSGAKGVVIGPIDVGGESPEILSGNELKAWFSRHGATEIEVDQLD